MKRFPGTFDCHTPTKKAIASAIRAAMKTIGHAFKTGILLAEYD